MSLEKDKTSEEDNAKDDQVHAQRGTDPDKCCNQTGNDYGPC